MQPLLQNDMLTFHTLFTQGTLLPAAPLFDEDGKPTGKPDVVSTDTGTCRPV